MRLFGNALAGWTLMTLIYQGMNGLGDVVINFVVNGADQAFNIGGVITPIVTPVLHAYFDLFSGLIQTTVFIFLTMINIGLEAPQEEDIQQISLERR